MNIFSAITGRTMRQNRTRTIVTIIGVVLSTAMITAVASFGVSFRQFLLDYSISRDGNWHLAAKSVLKEKEEELTGNKDVEQAATVTELGYALFEPVQESSPDMPYLCVRSLSEEALEMLPTVLSEGRMPENSNEVLIPVYLSANEPDGQKTKIGDTLTLELGERTFDGEHLNQNNGFMNGEYGDTETFTPFSVRSFEVVGVYVSWPDTAWEGAGYEVLAGPQNAGERDEALDRPVYEDVYLVLKHPRQVYQFTEEHLAEYSVIYNSSLLRWLGVVDNDNFYSVITGLMVILMLVIITGSVTLIYNAFSISLRERTAQFGLLSSIGATKKQLRGAMRYEALFVSVIGIPLGVVAGIAGTGITLHYIGNAIANWIHGVDTGIALIISPTAVGTAAVLALITVLISVWIPSRRIRRISPMEAIRSNADIKIRPGEVKTGGWAFALFGLPGMLAQKNYKRDRKKYRATVVSLTMSIVLFMSAALFNIYLVQTGAFVLDAPEISLKYREYEGSLADTAAQVSAVIERMQGIDSVFSYRRAYVVLQIPDEWYDADFANVYGRGSLNKNGKTPLEMKAVVLPDDVFASYAESCGIDAGLYENTDQLRLICLNEEKQYNAQTHRYERVRLFEKTTQESLETGRLHYGEEAVAFEKLGEAVLGDVVSRVPPKLDGDGDIEGHAAFLSQSMYDKFSGCLGDSIFISNIQCRKPGEVFVQLQKELEARGLDEEGFLQNLNAEYESDRNTLIAIRVLTYGFIVLISLIAVANIFNTISTNLLLRRKEFAMLRSMGMSQKGFRRMMNYECLIYGVRAIIYGVLLSILLGIAIRRAIGVGADVSFLIPWEYLGIAVAGTFLVVFITMFYTMHRIKKNNIVEELKMN